MSSVGRRFCASHGSVVGRGSCREKGTETSDGKGGEAAVTRDGVG
jgi:hypothetical protein